MKGHRFQKSGLTPIDTGWLEEPSEVLEKGKQQLWDSPRKSLWLLSTCGNVKINGIKQFKALMRLCFFVALMPLKFDLTSKGVEFPEALRIFKNNKLQTFC